MFNKKQPPTSTTGDSDCSCFTGRICGYHANRIDRWAQRNNQIEVKRHRVANAEQNEEKYFCGLCGCLMPISHFPH